MNILIPDNYVPEREYTIDVIFGEFLGLDYQLTYGETNYAVEIHLRNGNTLKLKDYFFGYHIKEKSYLAAHHIPSKIHFYEVENHSLFQNKHLPIIFGEKEIKIEEKEITCSIDFIAGVFFMLTRWEEYVISERDHYDRFPAHASLAHKNGFLQRPIVDEYVETIWDMLEHLGISQKRKERTFKIIPTHDVDTPLFWNSPYALPKKIAGDIIKRKSLSSAIRTLTNYSKVKSGKIKDPYDTFDFLMEVSERYNLQSHFYFLCGGNHKWDKGHLPPSRSFMNNLMEHINERGHIIGFHPSYDSYNNEEFFRQELTELQKHSPQEIKCGRQHFLRFSVPHTWRLWENTGLEWDSSMYYAEEVGFRCGTCHVFSVFDVLERRKMNLKEAPLLIMDGTFLNYKKVDSTSMLQTSKQIQKTVKKYKGQFISLWHNSSFGHENWEHLSRNYEELILAPEY